MAKRSTRLAQAGAAPRSRLPGVVGLAVQGFVAPDGASRRVESPDISQGNKQCSVIRLGLQLFGLQELLFFLLFFVRTVPLRSIKCPQGPSCAYIRTGRMSLLQSFSDGQ